MKKLIERLDALLAVVDRVLMLFAVLALCAIGLLTTVDVLMRYALNSPILFAFDLTSMFLFPASVMFVLSNVFRRNENIDIDLVSRKIPIHYWRALSVVGTLMTFVIFSIVTALYGAKTLHALGTNEVTFGAITWKTWPAHAIATAGFGFLSVALLVRCLKHLVGTTEKPGTPETQD